MWNELDRDRSRRQEREFLLDLGQMAVFWNGVRTDALVAFREQIVGFDFAPRAGNTAQARYADAAGLDQSFPHQGK